MFDRGLLPQRFWDKVQVDSETGCWRWTASTNQGGYGHIRMGKAVRPTHRLAYQTFVGPIPEGLEIDHLCRVRRCCNPEHLEAVTRTENVRRGESPAAHAARRTHCDRGHPYDGPNTYLRPDGGRACNACRRKRLREAARARRAWLSTHREGSPEGRPGA